MPSPSLTVRDVAHRLRCAERTARRRCAAWAASQHLAVPRVARAPRGRRGRPGYAVDPDSLAAWLRTAPSTDAR